MPRPRSDWPFGAALAACGLAWLWQWVRMAAASDEGAAAWVLPPLLAAYLLLARRRDLPPRAAPGAWRLPAYGAGAGTLVLLLLVRPFLEPFPGWPLGEWTYSLALLGFVLALLILRDGRHRAAALIGPLIVLVAALPWPAFITAGFMGWWRERAAGVLADLLTFAGTPAVADGTVLRLARGTIGIDEACGGIHSLQVAIVLGLALGELQRAAPWRRVNLALASTALALAANFLRLTALALLCARGGTPTVDRWHDTMDLLEFALVLGGLGLLAARRGRTAPGPAANSDPPPGSLLAGSTVPLATLAIILLPLAEIATQAWYRQSDTAAGKPSEWQARLPRDADAYVEEPFTPAMQALLHCDAHAIARWRGPTGAEWAGYVIEWRRGLTAQYVLATHNPDICLPLSGSDLVRRRPPLTIGLGDLALPFEAEEFRNGNSTIYVYFLAWDSTHGEPLAGFRRLDRPPLMDWADRWFEVANGRRSLSARLVTLGIFSAANATEADRAFRAEIGRIVLPAPSSGG